MKRLVFVDKPKTVNKNYKIKRTGGWRSVRLLSKPILQKWWEDPDVLVADRCWNTNMVDYLHDSH